MRKSRYQETAINMSQRIDAGMPDRIVARVTKGTAAAATPYFSAILMEWTIR